MSIWLLASLVLLGPIWSAMAAYMVFYSASKAIKDAELQHAKHLADAFDLESMLNNNTNTGDESND